MSYKTTRIYDFKLLDRLIDFDSLVDNAIVALSEFSQKNRIEGYIGCTLEILYPDLDLVDDTKGGWVNRVEKLTEKVHKRFADVDWAITNLRSNMFNVLDFAHATLPHRITTAVRKGKHQLLRQIEVSVPTRESTLSMLIVLRILLKMITPDWFQYADSARLTTWATVPPEARDIVVHQELGRKVPWKHWLRKDNTEEAVDFFQTPGVCELILEECKGYYMNADRAQKGERTVRRYLYDTGEKRPLEVNTPMDVRDLVENKGFYAFYSSCETREGEVGKVCIDLDARWMLSTLLGPENTWSMEVALTDAILEMTASLSWPIPAIKFSGARGIHIYWLLEKGAVGEEWIEVDNYADAVLKVDKDVMRRKTTESFMRPFGGLKLLTQALVHRAKYRYMDWSRVNLTPEIIAALGIRAPEQIITVGPLDDRHMAKMGVDVISQRKGVFRTVLSPHFKSGLVSRSIRNQFGQVCSEYRVWRYMRQLADREVVMEDIILNHALMRPNPGTLNRENLEELADLVRADVSMLLRFSPASASALPPDRYEIYEERYSKGWKPWRPWNKEQSNGAVN